ncbi:hypothetical protein FRB94_002370 [Tulasnella sp. JGI-2019a]|nr:hypothetical protein FRB93_004413 [Tulasnella sp. JGI-2019a]KAG9004426.1 hypothetical protein FRB94_002370 [Tulasnella sp. JGI-2019a]KAG9031651.1 hypothetical protein FRB95_002460 [Tulasnella sp. JGI-2019a]
MARVIIPQFRSQISPVSMHTVKRWVPSLGMWGVGAGTAVALLMSATPLFKNDVLVKIPVIGTYYEDHVPASDKPF